jgi:hypothetical protein
MELKNVNKEERKKCCRKKERKTKKESTINLEDYGDLK